MLGLKKIRLPAYDYLSNGYYFVTIVTRFRHPYFASSDNRAKCENIIRQAAHAVRGVVIDTMVVMADHLHVILVLENAQIGLGEIIRRMKARTSYEFHERLWQPNYYEHVIRTDQALGNIRAYIINNPNKEPTFTKSR